MARTDSLGNFLTDVADAIRTKKGSSDTILASDFDTEIENLPTGGNSQAVCVSMHHVAKDSSNQMDIIATNFFSSRYNGAYENTNVSSYSSNYKTEVAKGIVIAFVRSDYTLSNNLELIYETDWFTYDNLNQKLLVCWCEGDSATITTTASGRCEAEYIVLGNAKKITIDNIFLKTVDTDKTTYNYTVNATDKMCIFSQSCIYGIGSTWITPDNTGIAYSQGKDRLLTEISITAGQKTIIKGNQAPTAIIGIEVQAE